MNAKHITELKLEGFRGFSSLELKGLQAVNLIVGQNNAGKTSLLEAITAVAAPGLIQNMPGLFRANSGSVQDRYFKWLLADGTVVGEVTAQIESGTRRLTLALGALPERPEIGYKTVNNFGKTFVGWWAKDKVQMRVRVISVQHRSPDALVPSFADAVRSPDQQRLMEQLLSKVDPRIRDIRLDYADQQPFIAVDIGLSERVPLPQVGQGIYRLVAIFAELLGQQPQICLIDEIENGIHYTVMKQVWRGIAEVSALLGIQVFATTHSKECLEAAQEVFFDEDPENKRDFAVIQLMRVKDQVIGKVLNESRVEAALENDIELR